VSQPRPGCFTAAVPCYTRGMDTMHTLLPARLKDWVAREADGMGLPGPDDYILLVLRLEQQRQELAASVAEQPVPSH
jgi:hypothetical protein